MANARCLALSIASLSSGLSKEVISSLLVHSLRVTGEESSESPAWCFLRGVDGGRGREEVLAEKFWYMDPASGCCARCRLWEALSADTEAAEEVVCERRRRVLAEHEAGTESSHALEPSSISSSLESDMTTISRPRARLPSAIRTESLSPIQSICQVEFRFRARDVMSIDVPHRRLRVAERRRE